MSEFSRNTHTERMSRRVKGNMLILGHLASQNRVQAPVEVLQVEDLVQPQQLVLPITNRGAGWDSMGNYTTGDIV